ncbi:MAG: 4'-phosphopantetheinyl transferase superfamily protein [Rhodobacterales bacterium]|nr:4'-phosphopantetheinyl transferase superfamily protein [Rhodobacterales bacterium]
MSVLYLARSFLDPHVTVAGGLIADFQSRLWPGEPSVVARAVPSRLAEFTAGRTAARMALTDLGHPASAILKGPGGEPLWPAGITGSISHGGGFCIAAAAPASQARALGLDLEPFHPLSPDVAAEVCTKSEAARFHNQPDAGDLPLRIFCAKEAGYKAIYPLAGILLDFDAFDVTLSTDRTRFQVTTLRHLGPFPAGTVLDGHQGVADGLLLSVVHLRPGF